MADYRYAGPDVTERITRLVKDHEDLGDYREHPPEIAAVEVLYADENTFDAATKKRVGNKALRLLAVTDKALRFLFSGNGLGEGNGLDFILKVDPAVWNLLPEKAKDAHLFNALVAWYVERKEDRETGENIPKMDGDRVVWSKRAVDPVHPETLRIFGPFSKWSADAHEALRAAEKQGNLFDWRPAADAADQATKDALGKVLDGPGSGPMAPVEDEGLKALESI